MVSLFLAVSTPSVYMRTRSYLNRSVFVVLGLSGLVSLFKVWEPKLLQQIIDLLVTAQGSIPQQEDGTESDGYYSTTFGVRSFSPPPTPHG